MQRRSRAGRSAAERRSARAAQVYAWGCNAAGQLGVGDCAARRSPAAVDALWAMPVRGPPPSLAELQAGSAGGPDEYAVLKAVHRVAKRLIAAQTPVCLACVPWLAASPWMCVSRSRRLKS